MDCSRCRGSYMEIWVLTFWAAWVAPFEAGQYQTYEKCIAAASHQLPIAEKEMGVRLRWRCRRE